MFIDASAFLAILLLEPDAREVASAIRSASRRLTSPIAIYETVAALTSKKVLSRVVAERELSRFIATAEIVIVPVTEEIGRAALDAFDRYGKGRGHPAQLNMADCFAYACARVEGVPLLYKGNDFSRTDIG